MAKSKMGMSRLGGFSGIAKPPEPPDNQDSKPIRPLEAKAISPSENKTINRNEVVVNIKIRSDQQEWLAKTAKLVRQNNSSPVAPSDRVYPQHLIQVALDLMQSSDIDWENLKNVEDIKKALNL